MSRIETLLDDVLNRHDLPLAQAMDAHLAPDYCQRTDGAWSTRDEVAEHFAHLRTIARSAEVTVHEELTDRTTYAERHTVTVHKRGGGHVLQEVYVFGNLAPDGRFARLEEATMMLEGDEVDRGIGSARG